jgi:hypothetical protein
MAGKRQQMDDRPCPSCGSAETITAAMCDGGKIAHRIFCLACKALHERKSH